MPNPNSDLDADRCRDPEPEPSRGPSPGGRDGLRDALPSHARQLSGGQAARGTAGQGSLTHPYLPLHPLAFPVYPLTSSYLPFISPLPPLHFPYIHSASLHSLTPPYTVHPPIFARQAGHVIMQLRSAGFTDKDAAAVVKALFLSRSRKACRLEAWGVSPT